MRIAFRFKLVPFIATVVLVVLGIALGQWQTRRAEEKLALQAKLAAATAQAPLPLDGAAVTLAQAQWRRVTVRGTFVADWPVYLDNRPHGGQAGFYVLMPLRIEGSKRHVLVLRGWLPVDPAQRQHVLPYATPTGTVTLEGIARRDAGHVLQLGTAVPPAAGAIVQNADVAQVASASGLALLPFVVQQTSSTTDSLVRDWPAPELGVDKHRGYAFQWYALALTAFLFFVITGILSGRSSERKQNR